MAPAQFRSPRGAPCTNATPARESTGHSDAAPFGTPNAAPLPHSALITQVAFLDTDLEFHSFPKLFVPGSWPGGGRDVAAFNYWGNETDWEHASTPTTGSGVIFFNQTSRARGVLTAWAEAMAWDTNTRAPDDQVRSSTGLWICLLQPYRPCLRLP